MYTWPIQTTDESTPIDRPLMPTHLPIYQTEQVPYEISWTNTVSKDIQ
jgi:hypothetical protein